MFITGEFNFNLNQKVFNLLAMLSSESDGARSVEL